MKSKMVTLVLGLVFFQKVFSQNIGINVDVPTATLHVAGTVRIDTLPNVPNASFTLMSDSLGNLGKVSQQSLSTTLTTIPCIYGESIQAGDLVAVGNGTTGYLSTDQQNSPFTSFAVPVGDLVSQSFTTSPNALGIKAVCFRAGSNTQTTFTARIRKCVGGIPSGPDLGNAAYTHPQTNTAINFSLVFSPPVLVTPNTQYVLIVTIQGPNTTSLPFFYSNSNSYADGVRLYSTNNGATWTTFSGQDLVFSVYETQTLVGRTYRARSYKSSVLLDGAVNFSYASTSGPYGGVGDRMDNVIGVAYESGIAGETKRVFVGHPCDGFNNLIQGRTYYLDTLPGRIGLEKASGGALEKKVGFSIDTRRLFFEH